MQLLPELHCLNQNLGSYGNIFFLSMLLALHFQRDKLHVSVFWRISKIDRKLMKSSWHTSTNKIYPSNFYPERGMESTFSFSVSLRLFMQQFFTKCKSWFQDKTFTLNKSYQFTQIGACVTGPFYQLRKPTESLTILESQVSLEWETFPSVTRSPYSGKCKGFGFTANKNIKTAKAGVI